MQVDFEKKKAFYPALEIKIVAFDSDVITASNDDPYVDDGYKDLFD